MHYQELLASVQPDLVSRSGNYTGAGLLSPSLRYASALLQIISWRRQKADTHASLIKRLTIFLLLICLSVYNTNKSLWPFLPKYKMNPSLRVIPQGVSNKYTTCAYIIY